MKVFEAYEKSPDGKIWLNGEAAWFRTNALYPMWVDPKESYTLQCVSLEDLCSDNWEPEKLKEKCEACEEADSRIRCKGSADMVWHLKHYHCTC